MIAASIGGWQGFGLFVLLALGLMTSMARQGYDEHQWAIGARHDRLGGSLCEVIKFWWRRWKS